jgi:hypothetical protein
MTMLSFLVSGLALLLALLAGAALVRPPRPDPRDGLASFRANRFEQRDQMP